VSKLVSRDLRSAPGFILRYGPASLTMQHQQGPGPDDMIRILLAEDDDSLRHYLARALQNAGFEVDAVDRGTAALPLLQSREYDLLVSDIVMPEMDGIELAQRCAEVSPYTRVMFITGFAAVALKTNSDCARGRVLSKPFHLKDLVLEVERVFEDAATLATL
jgi:two-component system, cell cycle response regulator CpdR